MGKKSLEKKLRTYFVDGKINSTKNCAKKKLKCYYIILLFLTKKKAKEHFKATRLDLILLIFTKNTGNSDPELLNIHSD